MKKDKESLKDWASREVHKMQKVEKLATLIKEGHRNADDKGIADYEDVMSDIAEYLIANRVRVLPCNLYDKVYMVGLFTGQIIQSTVVGIICMEDDYTFLLENGAYLSFVKQVGETAFFSMEEAVEKVKEMRVENGNL